MPTIQEALVSAVALHQAGRLGEAAELYRRILTVDSGQPDARHLLGVLMRRAGDPRAAVRLISRAIACDPQLGEAYINLGNTLHELGPAAAAEASQRRATRLRPANPAAHDGLGAALRSLGRFAEAAAAHRQAIALACDQAESHNSHAIALQEQERLEEALAGYRRALALAPHHADALANMGVALRSLERLAEAIACQRRAIALRPDSPAPHSSLGLALTAQNRLDEAARRLHRAIALRPQDSAFHNNLATTLQAGNDMDGAIVAYRRAFALDPASPDPRRNLGIALLLNGDLKEGWPLYEARWLCRDSQPRPAFRQPQWDGAPLEGRTILLYGEQGLGDTLHFCRYIPMVAARGGRVLLVASPPLHPVLRGMPEIAQLLQTGDPMPAFDVQAPLLSLPLAFGTDLGSVPARVPYLSPDPQKAAAWGERLPPGGLRVGVVWAGSPTHKNDRNRSVPLELFAPLARTPGVRLFSIQKGPAAEAQAAAPPDGMPLVNLAPDIDDFADTAAIAANLDLVICVDTSVAHLCGALARPTWVLLPFAPDWRWLMDRSDSPWYPTLRLYRQHRPGDWGEAMERVERDLRALPTDGGGLRPRRPADGALSMAQCDNPT